MATEEPVATTTTATTTTATTTTATTTTTTATTATTTMGQRWLAAVPAALLVGLVLAVVGSLALDAWGFHLRGLHDLEARSIGFARLSVIRLGVQLASTVAIAVGLGALARRLPATEALLLRLAIGLLALVVAKACGTPYVRVFAGNGASWIDGWYLWGARLGLVAWLATAAALAFALRRHGDRGLAIGLGLGLVVAAVVNNPSQLVYEWTHFDDLRGDGPANLLIDVVATVAQGGTLLAAAFLLGDRAPVVPYDPSRSPHGIARVGSALVARVVIAMALVGLTFLAVAGRSPGMLKLTLTLVPASLLVAMIAMVSGMFQGGATTAVGAPRLRFAAAAALSLTGLVMMAFQAAAVYRLAKHRLARGSDDLDSFRRHGLEAMVSSFPYLTPALGLAGLLCLISALASLRRQHGEALGSADPSTAALMLGLFTAAAVGLQQWMSKEPREMGMLLVMTVLIAVANVVAQLAVARLCHKVAEGLMYAAPSGLPPARIHTAD